MNLHPTESTHHYYINALMLAFAILIACSPSGNQNTPPPTTQQAPPKSITTVMMDTVKGSISGAWQAVQTPLEDVGLKRQSIPELLKQISANPYTMPSPLDCTIINSEIVILDDLLGPDIAVVQNESASAGSMKMPSWQNRNQYIAEGSTLAQEKAADIARNQVSILPYRGWIRQISGANAHAKKVARAYEAGKLRRAFLKGMSSTMNCWQNTR